LIYRIEGVNFASSERDRTRICSDRQSRF
jgi:hypothetical protein